MADLSTLVPSLETCIKLGAAGFPLTSYHLWIQRKGGEWQLKPFSEGIMLSGLGWCAAPTLGELLDALPETIPHKRTMLQLAWKKYDGRYIFAYFDGSIPFYSEDRGLLRTEGENGAEAAALLYLDAHARGLLPPGASSEVSS